MKQIDLTITALSPLAIGQRKPGGSVSEALSYIPGTVIRGAIAKEILKHSATEPTAGDDFHKLFLDDTAAVFRNAYCAIAAAKDPVTDAISYSPNDGPIRVLPASALSSKTNPGFKPDKAGVFDSLIDGFCAKAQGHFYVPNDLEGNLVEPFSGFYSQTKHGYFSHTVSKRLLTRVGINRRRATAQDEILYSIEVMNESQGKSNSAQTLYRSSVTVQDEESGNPQLAEQLHTFLQRHCTNLRLGGSASRGLGKVTIEMSTPKDYTATPIEKRIDDFDNKLTERWNLWNLLNGAGVAPTQNRSFFTLTFQSDAILSENWRRTTVVSPAMLAPLIGLSEAEITLHTAHSGYDYRSGWNAAWGLPKDTELITKMGSVMLFSIPKEKKGDCAASLGELEKVGIGSRCSEGYGQINVCDEFHLVMREDAV